MMAVREATGRIAARTVVDRVYGDDDVRREAWECEPGESAEGRREVPKTLKRSRSRPVWGDAVPARKLRSCASGPRRGHHEPE